MASIRETIERLSDVQTGGRTNVEQLASKVNGNARLVEDIIQLVTKEAESELAFIVYEWLYNCYKLRHDDISLFVLQCTSPIIYNYLSAISSMNAQLQSHTEPCLLEIYNQVAVEGDAVRGKQAFSIPSVAKSSIYHHRKTLQGKPSSTPLLTESALNKHDLKSQKVASLSLSRISRVIACNRMSVVAVVLCRIQAVMLDMSLTARISFCHMCVRLVASGFPQWTAALSIDSLRFSHLQSSSSLSHSEIMELAVKQRLHLTSTVLHEMISSVYVCLYHDEYLAARQAVEAIRLRAQFDGVAHVLLAANAMLNGLKSIDGDPMAGPLGFSFASSQVMSRKTSTVKYQLDVIDHTDGNEALLKKSITKRRLTIQFCQKFKF
ncbi:hyccin-like isoform X2 [Corticium candelabrum]|uniref:hyccin-like isoform X2 n=1 Tax=Corticium candelabrum TaxID=121492 RepID=UPI002E26E553|nr:hyccin-like isoform X2 [Corticium candelabrum]